MWIKVSLRLTAIAFLLPSVAAAELPSLDRSRAGNYCEDQWTKRGSLDRRMYNYCMDRQQGGYSDAVALRKKYSSVPDIDKIADYAVREWLSARRYQYEMVAHEMERQIDAFLNIAYEIKSGRYAERDLLPCLAKWYRDLEPQWVMVEYCLEEQ